MIGDASEQSWLQKQEVDSSSDRCCSQKCESQHNNILTGNFLSAEWCHRLSFFPCLQGDRLSDVGIGRDLNIDVSLSAREKQRRALNAWWALAPILALNERVRSGDE